MNVKSDRVKFRQPILLDKDRLRKLAFRLLCNSMFVSIWQILYQKRRPAILCYHDPDPDIFSQHLDELKKRFNIISLHDYVKARINGTVEKLPKYPLIISLDDGHRGNFKLLEVIAKKCVPATIFLASGVVGTNRHFWWTYVKSEQELRNLKNERNENMKRHMHQLGFDEKAIHPDRQALSVEEIKTMAPYVDFQAHTRFHPVLPMCTIEEAQDEIHGCKQELSQNLSLNIYALAYPYGYYCDRDIELARKASYLCALTVDEGLNDNRTDLFRLKRIYMPDDADLAEVVIKASGIWAAVARLMRKRPEQGYMKLFEGSVDANEA